LEQADGLGDDFSVLTSLVSSLRILDVLVITVLELLVVLDLLLLSSLILFDLLVLVHGDSLVKSGDFVLEVGNLSDDLVQLGIEVLSVLVVFSDPVLVGSSLDFSGFGDLVQELLADGDDLLNSGGVSLDGGGGGDLGQELED